jgi:hypothetical protein
MMNHRDDDIEYGPETVNIEGNPHARLLGRGLDTHTPLTQHDNPAVRLTALGMRDFWKHFLQHVLVLVLLATFGVGAAILLAELCKIGLPPPSKGP